MSDAVKRPGKYAGHGTFVGYLCGEADAYMDHMEARLREVEQERDDLRRENARLHTKLSRALRLAADCIEEMPHTCPTDMASGECVACQYEWALAALQPTEAKTETCGYNERQVKDAVILVLDNLQAAGRLRPGKDWPGYTGVAWMIAEELRKSIEIVSEDVEE
jgi:hypothetical protein